VAAKVPLLWLLIHELRTQRELRYLGHVEQGSAEVAAKVPLLVRLIPTMRISEEVNCCIVVRTLIPPKKEDSERSNRPSRSYGSTEKQEERLVRSNSSRAACWSKQGWRWGARLAK
jgi:hypothetical protein